MANLGTVLEVVTATDPGMVRSHNEDSIAADAEIGLAVLADGMGGYNAGEVASGIAVAMLTTEMKQALETQAPHMVDGDSGEPLAARLIEENSAKANAAIYQAAKSQPQYAGMGTTLVVALFYDNRMSVGHIGDSRLYRLRNEEFEQVTRDHSLLHLIPLMLFLWLKQADRLRLPNTSGIQILIGTPTRPADQLFFWLPRPDCIQFRHSQIPNFCWG